MANTITHISNANTFGEWVVATDSLVTENNILAKGDYNKDSGTLYLSETAQNALWSNGTVVIQKELHLQGVGSYATIDQNMYVAGQVYFSNTTLGLTNSGQANINGLLVAQGPGLGLSVANNTYIGGNTTVRYNTITDTVQANTSILTDEIQANTSVLTGTIQSNTSVNTANASITGTVYTKYLQANTSTNTQISVTTQTAYADKVQANTSLLTGTVQANTSILTGILQANSIVNTQISSVTQTSYADKVQANTSILTGVLQANSSVNTANASITGTVYTKILQANTSTNTETSSVTGISYTNVLQANSSVNTANASITGTVYTNVLQANTSTNTANASITGTVYTNVLQANSSVNTANASITGTVYTKILQANTNILTGVLQANSSVNTANASITGTVYTNVLQANTSTNTQVSSTTQTSFTNVLQANTSTNTQISSVTQTSFTNVLQANTSTNTANASITGTVYTNILQANTSTNTQVSSTTQTSYADKVQANTSLLTGTIQANTSILTGTIQANTSLLTGTIQANTSILTGVVQANTSTNTANASITGTVYTKILQANTSTNTETSSVTGISYTNVLQANTSTNTANASITGTVYTKILQANVSTNTQVSSTTQTSYADKVQANTSLLTGTIQANTSILTGTVQANTTINTQNIFVTTNTTSNVFVANNYIRTPDIYTTNVSATGKLGSTSAVGTVYSMQVGVGGLSVDGSFTLNGDTVYNTTQLTLSANDPNQISYYSVYRTNNSLQLANSIYANASIRWNETNYIWELNDVYNTDLSTTYSQILTANLISDVSTSTSVETFPTSRLVTGLYTQSNSAFLKANASYESQNTTGSYANAAFLQANGAFIQANSSYASQNTTGSYANSAFLKANSAYASQNVTGTYANSAYTRANNSINANTGGTITGDLTITGNLFINGTTTTVNTTSLSVTDSLIKLANNNTAGDSLDIGFYGTYNSTGQKYAGLVKQAGSNFLLFDEITTDPTSNNLPPGTLTAANVATLVANIAGYSITSNGVDLFLYTTNSYTQANAAFLTANTPTHVANSAALYANGAFLKANSSYESQNVTGSYANSAFLKANAAYTQANTAANTFVGTTGTVLTSSGVISFSSNNGVTVVATRANNFAINTPQDLQTANTPTFAGLVLTTQLGTAYGGTGATSPQGALNNLLPTGTTAGYVLTTGGPNNFYWAAGGGGGGGATPGTTINSTRLSYTANGQSGYTGNSFIIPTASTSTQVRAYINGVRQFESEYTANLSSNTITFTTTPPSGDAILIEVDGYYVNPYYANNIAFTINSNISPTANTIQLAIDGLTTKLTTYYANLIGGSTFTGIVSGITIDTGVSNTAFATTAHVQNSISPAFLQANTAVTNAATADSKAVSAGLYANGAFIQANAAFLMSNTAPAIANSAALYANGAFVQANAAFLVANTPPAIANSAALYANGAFIQANAAFLRANTPDAIANSAAIYANGAFIQANTPSAIANSAALYANGAFIQANAAFIAANTITNGNVQFYSIGVGTAASSVSGEIRATSTITAGYSDDNLKTKLGNIENALDKVMSLNGFYYEPNQTAQDLGYIMKKEVGVSAQEVEKVLPEIVVPAPIDNKYLTIQYEKMVPLLIEAIKELKQELDALKGNKQ